MVFMNWVQEELDIYSKGDYGLMGGINGCWQPISSKSPLTLSDEDCYAYNRGIWQVSSKAASRSFIITSLNYWNANDKSISGTKESSSFSFWINIEDFTGHTPWRNHNSKRHVYSNVHNSTVYDSHYMEAS